MNDTDLKATKDSLLSQLEEAKTEGKVEKAEPKYQKPN